MNKLRKKWAMVTIITIIFLGAVVVAGYARAHFNTYHGINCIDCFRMQHYLRDTGQPLWAEEMSDVYEKTINSVAYQFRSMMLWICESCAYFSAEMLYLELEYHP